LGKVEQAIRQQLDKQDSLKRRRRHDMVLDGEICVYPSSGDNDLESRKEDFLTTMRQIRTLKRQMDDPVYQIFDVIGLDVFRQGKGGPLFQERQQQLEDFIRSYQGDYLSLVQQTPVSSPDQLAVLKDKVARFGWEGLIVRKNVKYEGKRR
jgi:DNA ligase-1